MANRGGEEQKKPHFFKVLLGDFSHRLRIPPNFVKHISEETSSERAVLEGPSGSIWPVELGKTSNGMFLTGGWQNFVKDNSLQEFEFLVFRYDGEKRFCVQIFDKSACEREDVFSIKSSIHLDSDCLAQHNKACEVESTSDGVVSGCCYSWQNGSINSGRCHWSSKPDLPNSTDAPCPSLSTTEPCIDEFLIGQHPKITGKYLSQRRPVSAEERERASKTASCFMSKFPYFVKCMTICYVYKTHALKVPQSFASAHLPKKKMQLVLQDPKGKLWTVRFLPGGNLISHGWVAFARGNNLEDGDCCVFELVHALELHVHIFRVVEEVTPLIMKTVK